MLISLLPVPFANAARQRQFEALEAALQTEADAPATVLLGNLAAWAGLAADALLVRPTGLVVLVLVLVPGAGHLTMPALAYGGWQLDGQPLPDRGGADNPFTQYQQQANAAQAWLAAELGLLAERRPVCYGLALFDGPLTFDSEVEVHLHQHAAARHFELLSEAARVPAWLHQQLVAGPNTLDEDDLLDWADDSADSLAASPLVPAEHAATPAGSNYLAHKLRQLWRWLGAEDIPADPPYGGSLPDPHLRDEQEQARLQQLRHELQAELNQQRQEATTREAARTQELTQLRQQLAQAGLSATARRAEQEATARLENELRTTRADLAARNHELDTRIQQLGLLIKQLQTTAAGKPAPAAATAPAAANQPAARVAARPPTSPALARPAAKPGTPSRRLRQAERWGLVVLVLAGIGAGTLGMVRLVHPPKARPTATAKRRSNVYSQAEEGAGPGVVYVVDSTLAPTGAEASESHLYSTDQEPAAAPAPAAPARQLADSAATPPPATPAPAAAPDSAATPSPSP